MRTIWTIPVLAALAATAGAAAQFERPVEGGEAKVAERLRGLEAQPTLTCVSARQLRESDVIDGTAIVYRASGSRRYVNRPRGALNLLTQDTIIVTRTGSSQLCEGDPVDLVSRAEREPVASLILGPFVPYERAKTPKL